MWQIDQYIEFRFQFIVIQRTELSKPRVKSIMKKISAQNIDPGMVAMAAGYTMNTSPGPSVATSWIDLPLAFAMYPSTEKITNPAMNDVALLITLVNKASLKELHFWLFAILGNPIFRTISFFFNFKQLTCTHYYDTYCSWRKLIKLQIQDRVRKTLVLLHRPIPERAQFCIS